jgi:hypothetical protein
MDRKLSHDPSELFNVHFPLNGYVDTNHTNNKMTFRRKLSHNRSPKAKLKQSISVRNLSSGRPATASLKTKK